VSFSTKRVCRGPQGQVHVLGVTWGPTSFIRWVSGVKDLLLSLVHSIHDMSTTTLNFRPHLLLHLAQARGATRKMAGSK